MKTVLLIASLLCTVSQGAWAQKVDQHKTDKRAALKAGPMVCWSEMREAAIWVQTTGQAQVQVLYTEKGVTGVPINATETVSTSTHLGHTATLVADKLEPGRRYTYEVLINGKKLTLPYPAEFEALPQWQYRTDAPTFTVAVGSCTYVNDSLYDRPGKGYGSDYDIFKAIHQARPNAMLWIGDNVYTRDPDFYSRTGLLYRHGHTRALPQMQALLASTHNYALWDDHDFGPNDSDRGYHLKTQASEIFSAFFPAAARGLTPAGAGYDEALLPGAATSTTPVQPGSCTSTFGWGDVQFFLLDDRWFRAPNDEKNPDRDYFGAAQLRWLEDQLISSKAKFKVIASGGQLISPATVFENYAIYPTEQRKFLELIARSEAKGVILLSGDRHHTELMKLPRTGTYPLYELTTSPLTAGVANPKEDNPIREPNTLVKEHNFALLTFSGPNADRLLTLSIRNKTGTELWKREIKASELK